MKLAVIGNKEFTDYERFCNILSKFDKIKIIVSGGAIGTDSMAKRYAIEKGIDLKEFPPQYKIYGSEAKHIRDKQIIDNCDRVLAFWDGKCEGTSHTIEYAIKKNRSVKIIRI